MKLNFFTTIILAGMLLLLIPESWKSKGAPKQESAPPAFTLDSAKHLPERFIDHGNYTFQSESICTEAYGDLKRLGIQRVIRLNGNGHDAGCMTIEEEAQAAADAGIQFFYFNIDGGDDIKDFIDLLKGGYTVVHCKHGAHRAALVIGSHLLRKGLSITEVEEMIGWTQGPKPVLHDRRYQRYVDQLLKNTLI